MTHEEISYNELAEVVRLSLIDDADLFSFYDPNVLVKSIEEIVLDMLSKAISHGENVRYFKVLFSGALVGYFFYKEKMLISFGIKKQYRVRKCKKHFFKIIKQVVGNNFTCILWNKNLRAIKFLIKMGMRINVKDFIFNGNLLTQLIN